MGITKSRGAGPSSGAMSGRSSSTANENLTNAANVPKRRKKSGREAADRSPNKRRARRSTNGDDGDSGQLAAKPDPLAELTVVKNSSDVIGQNANDFTTTVIAASTSPISELVLNTDTSEAAAPWLVVDRVKRQFVLFGQPILFRRFARRAPEVATRGSQIGHLRR